MKLKSGITFEYSKQKIISMGQQLFPENNLQLDTSIFSGEKDATEINLPQNNNKQSRIEKEIDKWKKKSNTDSEVMDCSVCWLYCYGTSGTAYKRYSKPDESGKNAIQKLWPQLFENDFTFDDFNAFVKGKTQMLNGSVENWAHQTKVRLNDKLDFEAEGLYSFLKNKRGQGENEMPLRTDSFKELLEANFNLILTGAPGTGKTYLAKQIAMQMIFKNDPGNSSKDSDTLEGEVKKIFDEHFEFVQFHPSYDYTDFVEGLRPTEPNEKGNIGFELKNGVFMDFCLRAVKKYMPSNFDEQYNNFITDLEDRDREFTTKNGNKFKYTINSKGTIEAKPVSGNSYAPVTKERIRDYVLNNKKMDYHNSYLIPLGDYFKDKYPVTENKPANDIPYIFVIDEINRGEISKIFGELFFSTDPGYRGEKGKVNTQYANMQNKNDLFGGWFYVPNNVYIIGTMNDIDRSVESMDFAMRRRFTWVEITADESARNMELPKESIERMENLNKAIEKIEGLNSSYHIGGAYFKKLENNDYDKLWTYHLKSLLHEYLRGIRDSDTELENLEDAFYLR